MATIPTYFTANPDYKTWSLHSFLASELSSTATIDNATKRRLGDAWNSTLLHYAADDENQRRAGWAERLRREWKDKSTNSQAAFNSWVQAQDPTTSTSTPAPSPVPSVPSTSAPASLPPPAPPSRAPRKTTHKRPRASPLSRVSATTTSSSASVSPDDSISIVSTSSSSSSAASGPLTWCIPSAAELQAQYDAMKRKGGVEALVHGRAVEACARGAGFDAAMLWVVDEAGRKAVSEAVEKEREGERMVEVEAPRIPEVPERVVRYLERFRETTSTPPTLSEILHTASQAHADLFPTPTHPDKLWIDSAMSFAHRLTSARFLSLPLTEGTYDSSVHPVFWQNYFLDGPLWVQQKETKLPTASPLAALRWDGIFLPKRALANGTRPAFGLMEVCRDIGSDAVKSRRDWVKLMLGLREVLRVLRGAVGGGVEVEGRLAVVGVLLTGAQTTVMVMSCAGENLYSVVEGGTHVFPTEMEAMVAGVEAYLKPIWRAKEIMLRSHAVVEECFRGREYVI